jgi:uncharacterized protein (TIGR02147 family)
MERPDCYTYLNYRDYLRALLAAEKAKNRHFSHRYFARVAGFSSPSYLKMVMDGKRNLTPSSIHQFSKAFKMGHREAGYFEALVLFNQAKSEKEQELYFERLTALRPTTALKGLEKDQYEYYTLKHFVIIREMVALSHFQEDPNWIAKHLSTPIKPRDVRHALEVLLRLKLLARNAQGALEQCDESVATPPDVVSMEVVQFHRTMLDDAKESLFKVAPKRRDISSLTVPIPIGSIKAIKERIQNFRQELLDLINSGSQDFDEVYQLNIQLFPLTKTGR